MDAVVTLEYRFARTPGGEVWTASTFAHEFWTQYLDVFDHVYVVARLADTPRVVDGWRRANGPHVSFMEVPHYVGPGQFIRSIRQIRHKLGVGRGQGRAVIMRVPSTLARLMEADLAREGAPYAVQVVGDPHEVFAPASVHHPFRAFFRWWFRRSLRRQCKDAVAIAYVPSKALRARYPPGPHAFVTSFSDAMLDDDWFADASGERGDTVRTLVTVGALDQPYKGTDVLIDAVARARQRGLDLHVVVIGDGRLRSRLERRSAKLDLGGGVEFLGALPSGAPVREWLDRADIFVLPSRTEGLPRALLEAMARGLPCIGSSVGGIADLLVAEDLVRPGEPSALADKIVEVARDRERRQRMSLRNRETARDFRDEVFAPRRAAFYRHVKHVTQEWLKTRRSP